MLTPKEIELRVARILFDDDELNSLSDVPFFLNNLSAREVLDLIDDYEFGDDCPMDYDGRVALIKGTLGYEEESCLSDTEEYCGCNCAECWKYARDEVTKQIIKHGELRFIDKEVIQF